MSILNRPMFRIPGLGGNQPSGIMASSPNLIQASAAQASPLNKAFQIPMYKDKAPSVSELIFNPRTFPNVIDSTQKINTGDIEGTRVAEDIKKLREKSNLEKLKEAARRSKIQEGAKVADTFDADEALKGKTQVGAGMDDADADYFGGDVPVSEAPFSNEGTGKAD